MLSAIPIIQQHNVSLQVWGNVGIYATIILLSGLSGITLSMIIKKKFIKTIHKAQKTNQC